eukprot:gene38392-40252_t
MFCAIFVRTVAPTAQPAGRHEEEGWGAAEVEGG